MWNKLDNSSVCIDVGTWEEGFDKDQIKFDVLSSFRECPKEIWITGNFSKWCRVMDNDIDFALSCLDFVIKKKSYFTDDGGNFMNYHIYFALIFGNKKISTIEQFEEYHQNYSLISSLKRNYQSFEEFVQDCKKLNLPTNRFLTN